MLRRALAVLFAGGLALSLTLGGAGTARAGAQDAPPTAVPAPNIVPAPNSGEAPSEAGDRGGALQLALLGLIVLAIVGGAVHVTRQARRARASGST